MVHGLFLCFFAKNSPENRTRDYFGTISLLGDIDHVQFYHKNSFLFPSFSLDQEEQEKLDRFLLFLEESGVSKILNSVNTNAQRTEEGRNIILVIYLLLFFTALLLARAHFVILNRPVISISDIFISWIKSALPSRPSLTSSISTLFPIRIRSSLLLSIISSKRLESIMMWFSLMVRKLRQMRININSFGSPLRFIFASAIRSEPF